MSSIIQIAIKAAHKVGDLVVKAFWDMNRLNSSLGSRQNYIDRLKTIIVEQITDIIEKTDNRHIVARPNNNDDENLTKWFIEPINGTNNFIQEIPYFAICLFGEKKGQAKFAIVYDPIRDETFSAIYNTSMQFNQIRVLCKNNNEAKALVAISDSKYIKELKDIKNINFRITGCSALDIVYTAKGSFAASVISSSMIISNIAELMLKESKGFLHKINTCENQKENDYLIGKGVFFNKIYHKLQAVKNE